MADDVNTPEHATETLASAHQHAPQPENKKANESIKRATDNDKTLPIPGKETFSREYVSELREENQAWKQKYEKTLVKLEKIKHDSQESLSQAQQSANERIIRAELKAHALKAGLIDVDDLKLADLSIVRLNEAGSVEGAQQMLEALKAAKPYLFALSGQSSSRAETPPIPKPSTIESVQNLPREAYEKRKTTYLRSV